MAELIKGASESLVGRILDKIAAPAADDACWFWMGSYVRESDGKERPKIQVGGRGSRTVTVARLLLCLADGVPLVRRRRREAAHRCGHWWCVNPAHLRWATREENERDKFAANPPALNAEAAEAWARWQEGERG
jgi:hypothetical protein